MIALLLRHGQDHLPIMDFIGIYLTSEKMHNVRKEIYDGMYKTDSKRLSWGSLREDGREDGYLDYFYLGTIRRYADYRTM